MESPKIKCSLLDHKDSEAIIYCQECKIYMCKKCQNTHSGLCLKHHTYKLENGIKNIFTGFCEEENHFDKLEFYCKTHNKLCCTACICKIKRKGKGQHTDCDICIIEDIKNEKEKNLENNINCLDNLSKTLQESIDKLKTIFQKISQDKEELKINIQKIFTKIRNTLNEREDEILNEVDNQFNNLFFKEEIIKESEKLPNKVKISLQKGQLIKKDWNDDDKLNLLINECIIIENNIQDINKINENMEKCNSKNIKIYFNPQDNKETEELDNFLETIKKFGNITYIDFKYTFKKCLLDINENKKFSITGEKENIFTKLGKDEEWVGTICEKELEKNKRHIWKIKVLNTQNYEIMVGVAPIDFDINSSEYNNCGWYFNCSDSCLYSGPPFNKNGDSTDFERIQEEITVVLDLNKKTLGFYTDNGEQEDVFYSEIPIDKPLFPAVFLYNTEDSIEILEEEE